MAKKKGRFSSYAKKVIIFNIMVFLIAVLLSQCSFNKSTVRFVDYQNQANRQVNDELQSLREEITVLKYRNVILEEHMFKQAQNEIMTPIPDTQLITTTPPEPPPKVNNKLNIAAVGAVIVAGAGTLFSYIRYAPLLLF